MEATNYTWAACAVCTRKGTAINYYKNLRGQKTYSNCEEHTGDPPVYDDEGFVFYIELNEKDKHLLSTEMSIQKD